MTRLAISTTNKKLQQELIKQFVVHYGRLPNSKRSRERKLALAVKAYCRRSTTKFDSKFKNFIKLLNSLKFVQLNWAVSLAPIFGRYPTKNKLTKLNLRNLKLK